MNPLEALVDCCSDMELADIHRDVQASNRFDEETGKQVAAYLFAMSRN
jgi:hypothetical protein